MIPASGWKPADGRRLMSTLVRPARRAHHPARRRCRPPAAAGGRMAAAVRPVVLRPGAVGPAGRPRATSASPRCDPTTGATVWPDDLVSPDRLRTQLTRSPGRLALRRGDGARIAIAAEPGCRIRRVVIPVRYGDQMIAVMNRDSELVGPRDSSLLETVYLEAADDLLQMIAEGSFPPPEQPAELITGPRAGDGLLRLDTSRHRHLHQPERAVRLPPAGSRRRASSAATWPTRPRT